jgi:Peptidase family M23
MVVFLRLLLLLALTLVYSIPDPASAAQAQGVTVAAPGTLVRWAAPGTKRCGMQGRSWAALHETCYYPVDLLQKQARITITRWGPGQRQLAHISVEPYDYGTEEIDLPNIPQANPSREDLQRDSRDQVLLSKIWNRKEGPAMFTLPLGTPARPLPKGKSFGVKRIFNGKPASQPHTGADYATPVGTPVLAVADGTIVFAKDMFFEGNAVFIDHGDGLISMYFHLSEIKVQAGQEVKKGHTLGRVGSTGRATGPHLFFGIRWHDARINPDLLLEDLGKIPTVN